MMTRRLFWKCGLVIVDGWIGFRLVGMSLNARMMTDEYEYELIKFSHDNLSVLAFW